MNVIIIFFMSISFSLLFIYTLILKSYFPGSIPKLEFSPSISIIQDLIENQMNKIFFLTAF